MKRVVWLLLVLAGTARGQGPFERIRVIRDIPYADTEHGRQRLDLVLPREKGGPPRPLVVFIHGGAWMQGDKSGGVRRLERLVAEGGYAGATIGYRLSQDAIWPAQIHDCKAAIRWLRAHAEEYGIDPERIAVWGTSAGGHLSAMLGVSGGVDALEGSLGAYTGVSSRVTCAIDFCGPSDLGAIAEVTNAINHGAADSPESKLLGCRPVDCPDAARSASPLTYVSPDDPPFLIVHGTEDRVVPVGQSKVLDAALRAAGTEAAPVFIRMVQGGHGFGGAELDRRVEGFLRRHLRGGEEEVDGSPIQAAPSGSMRQGSPSSQRIR